MNPRTRSFRRYPPKTSKRQSVKQTPPAHLSNPITRSSCPSAWAAVGYSQTLRSPFELIFLSPSLSGFTAESLLILIPGLQRAVREQFDKRVECFIPPCYSEVNYRCNQFHATLRWFYDDGEENGGLHFYLSELYIIITVRSLWSWLNLTVSSMFIKWDNWNSEWSTSRDNARIRPKC